MAPRFGGAPGDVWLLGALPSANTAGPSTARNQIGVSSERGPPRHGKRRLKGRR